MLSRWETLKSTKINDLIIFTANRVTRRHPTWDKTSDFVVLDTPEWVNIIPINTNKEVVFVEQFRHGTSDITLEVPGGLIESGEEPRMAGQRECTEETGYTSGKDAILIGENFPNPAFLNNKCYSFVWFGCEKMIEQSLDGNEDINVRLIPLSDIKQMITDGVINHSLVLNAFFFFSLKYGL